MKRLGLLFVACSFAVAFFSCSSEENKTGVSEENIDELLDKEIELDSILVEKGIVKKLDHVIENLVMSDQMIELLSSDSALYTAELLHSPNAISKYSRSKEKAIALGVYGADMNYVLHYEQTQQSFKYLLASKGLAENIGVAMAFDQKTMQNYQENTSHKDSLITIVHTAYGNVKKHLKNGDQFLMSSLVIAGTWVENMYLATEHYAISKDEQLKQELGRRILLQNDYLTGVIVLLNDLTAEDDEYVKSVVSQLEGIKTIYLSDSPDNEKISLLSEKILQIRNSLLLNE